MLYMQLSVTRAGCKANLLGILVSSDVIRCILPTLNVGMHWREEQLFAYGAHFLPCRLAEDPLYEAHPMQVMAAGKMAYPVAHLPLLHADNAHFFCVCVTPLLVRKLFCSFRSGEWC